MDDLIERLRDDSGDWLTDLAADRIEALEARVAAADKLAKAVRNSQLYLGAHVIPNALAAYEATKEGE